MKPLTRHTVAPDQALARAAEVSVRRLSLMRSEGARRTSVAELLTRAREQLDRLTPEDARAAARDGAVVIDIRPSEQRERDGEVPGARVIPRNVLEWRLDPACEHRDPGIARPGRRVILICDEGYQSSLAAATLRGFGLDATDVIGGAQAWRAAGEPLIDPGPR
jgi:rhodanese-related sulfurtransferase